MTEFRILRFGYLPNIAHANFINRVSAELVTAGTAVIGSLGTLPAEFELWRAKENALVEWVRKDALTKLIAEAAKNMDRALVGMTKYTRSLRYSAIPETASAAVRFIIMIDGYGRVYELAYEAQEGSVSAILWQIDNDYANDAKLLSLDVWVADLKSTFTKFQQLLSQRDTRSLLKPDETFKQVRKGVEGVYHQIVKIVDAGAVLNLQSDYGKFIDQLNPEIDRLNLEYHRVRHNIAHSEPAPIPQQAFTGEAVTPVPDVYYVTTHSGTLKLVLGKDFSVTYRNNISVGNAQCIIHGKGGYKGSKTVTFIIAR
jgi:hypothetical protein